VQTQTQPKSSPPPPAHAPNSPPPHRRPTLSLVTSFVLPEGWAGTNWKSQRGKCSDCPCSSSTCSSNPCMPHPLPSLPVIPGTVCSLDPPVNKAVSNCSSHIPCLVSGCAAVRTAVYCCHTFWTLHWNGIRRPIARHYWQAVPSPTP